MPFLSLIELATNHPSQTYACSYQNCDRVFTKAYELKKHKAIHENPDRYVQAHQLHVPPSHSTVIDSIFRCPHQGCEFYTLQKKNLAIHVSIQ